jgi:hypothetical protein
MPADYVIWPSDRLVVSRGWGVLTEIDVREHCGRLAADPRFESGYYQLADLTGIVSFAVPPQALAESTGVVPFDAGVRRAFVVASAAQREAASIIATNAADYGHVVRVFGSVDAANRWLADRGMSG